MGEFDLVVCGEVVLPNRVLPHGFVAVRAGKVALVGEGAPPAAREKQDFAGCYVMPGAIDGQVHSRSQAGQEDFVWSTRAAAAGGVTTIIDMPYDAGRLICNAERVRLKATEAAQQARVDFGLFGTIHPQDGTRHIAEMVEAGVCAFKFSTFGTDPERFPRIPPYQLYECFSELANYGIVASVHNENEEVVQHGLRQVRASGITDYRAHTMSRPVYSETLAINEIYELAAATGCRGHVVHCSTGRGYEICAAYRAQGHRTTIECCLHYLTLSEEDDVSRLGGRAKINPPIRGRAEREALWHHLAAGNVTIVSTDHVSWSLEKKTLPNMLDNASGANGLEVLMTMLLTGCQARALSPCIAARVLAHNPAQLFNLTDQKGALAVGCDADIAVLKHDPHPYDGGASGHNFVSWSPYEGMRIDYRVAATYVRGQLVFDGSRVLAEPGFGRFLQPYRAQHPGAGNSQR
jgi:allantoinase